MADPLSSTANTFAPALKERSSLFETGDASNIMGRYRAAKSEAETSNAALEAASKRNKYADDIRQSEFSIVQNDRLKRVWDQEAAQFQDADNFRKIRGETYSRLGEIDPESDDFVDKLAIVTAEVPGLAQDDAAKAIIQAKQSSFDNYQRSKLEDKRYEQARLKETAKAQYATLFMLKNLGVSKEEMDQITDPETKYVDPQAAVILSGVKQREKEEQKLSQAEMKEETKSFLKTMGTDQEVLSTAHFATDVPKMNQVFNTRFKALDTLGGDFDSLQTSIASGNFTVESAQAEAARIVTNRLMGGRPYDPLRMTPEGKAEVDAAVKLVTDAVNARLGMEYALKKKFRETAKTTKTEPGSTNTEPKSGVAAKPANQRLDSAAASASSYIKDKLSASLPPEDVDTAQ